MLASASLAKLANCSSKLTLNFPRRKLFHLFRRYIILLFCVVAIIVDMNCGGCLLVFVMWM